MEEKLIRTQAEMDAVDVNFDGVIKIIGLKINIHLNYKYRVEAWENASVEARENASVVARGNASVVAWENASVEAWENASVRISSPIKFLAMFGFSVVFLPLDLKFKFHKEKTCLIQRYTPQKYLDREGIKPTEGSVILYKKTSKEWLTQENTSNETKWEIGSTVVHHSWNPGHSECGEGKFHACSRPYFCDEFRNVLGDRYIAIKINIADLYEWENAQYPHKIAFRAGEVLYEVDKFSREVAAEQK